MHSILLINWQTVQLLAVFVIRISLNNFVTGDVNSREIAFLGQEMQFPGLDRDSRFRPIMYLLPT